jgi:hypothetical protein
MSSMNVGPSASGGSVRTRTRVWSITLRLTLLYVASTGLLLLLAAGFLYWALQRSLDARDHALLVSKLQVLRLLLREQPQATDVLTNEIEHEASASPLRYFMRILDDDKRVLIETPGMKELLPLSVFPAPLASAPAQPSEVTDKVGHHGTFLLLSARTVLGGPEPATRIVQVALDVASDLALLTGDSLLIRRAVSNLLANALRNTPEGGHIRISVGPAANRWLEIRVQDTGCGIAAEHLPRIFDRFYRVDKARSQPAAGTGLGLAIVQSLLRLHAVPPASRVPWVKARPSPCGSRRFPWDRPTVSAARSSKSDSGVTFSTGSNP